MTALALDRPDPFASLLGARRGCAEPPDEFGCRDDSARGRLLWRELGKPGQAGRDELASLLADRLIARVRAGSVESPIEILNTGAAELAARRQLGTPDGQAFVPTPYRGHPYRVFDALCEQIQSPYIAYAEGLVDELCELLDLGDESPAVRERLRGVLERMGRTRGERALFTGTLAAAQLRADIVGCWPAELPKAMSPALKEGSDTALAALGIDYRGEFEHWEEMLGRWLAEREASGSDAARALLRERVGARLAFFG